MNLDVAIIGGGPGGSTCGAMLAKYAPQLRVAIFERERFPRDHIGESQLPPIGAILDELGVWDKVEAADFPIKIGVTFRWGAHDNLWDFELLPASEFRDEPRPAQYVGQRRRTAFQVDRSRYDQILLDHAQESGCEVFQETRIVSVESEGDRVTALVLPDGQRVTAKHYVDASGNAAILRKAMKVPVSQPTSLQNVAFWDYWENTDWAVEIGVGGTRAQILSLGYGWIWFIPLGPTRTSVGFVCPATYYRDCRMTPEQLYAKAISEEPRVVELCRNGSREGKVRATKDWSFTSDRMVGENWMLVGEAGGFADPILSAGMTLTQSGAREAAYTILAIERQEHDPSWLKGHYAEIQRRRLDNHIRFADFWYSANGVFTDLKAYTSEIAKASGFTLDAEQAFRWLGAGGFANDLPGQVGLGGLDLAGVKQITQRFTSQKVDWALNQYNVFRMNLDGAERDTFPVYQDGRIQAAPRYQRKGKTLALVGMFKMLAENLTRETDAGTLVDRLKWELARDRSANLVDSGLHYALQVLETMVEDGWVTGRMSRSKPRISLSTPEEGAMIHANRDDATGRRKPDAQ